MSTEQHHFKRATVAVELYDGTRLTLELNDDPEGIRLEGEIQVDTGKRQMESDLLPWVVYEPGASTAIVRLAGPGGFIRRRATTVPYGVPDVADPTSKAVYAATERLRSLEES